MVGSVVADIFPVMSPNVSTSVNWTDNSLMPTFSPQKPIKLLWRCLAAALQTRLCGFSILFKYSKRHFLAVNALACNVNISVVSRLTRWPVFHRPGRYFAANLAEAGKKPVFLKPVPEASIFENKKFSVTAKKLTQNVSNFNDSTAVVNLVGTMPSAKFIQLLIVTCALATLIVSLFSLFLWFIALRIFRRPKRDPKRDLYEHLFWQLTV